MAEQSDDITVEVSKRLCSHVEEQPLSAQPIPVRGRRRTLGTREALAAVQGGLMLQQRSAPEASQCR